MKPLLQKQFYMIKILIIFLALCITLFAQQRFEKLNGPMGGIIMGLYAKGDTLLAGTGIDKGVIYYSTNRGESWNQASIEVAPRFQDFVYSPVRNEFYAVAHKAGIYHSTNLFDWQRVFLNNEEFWSVGTDHEGNIYAGTNNGKIYTTSNGNNWSLSLSNAVHRIENFFLASDSTLFAGSTKKIYKKEKNSTNWTLIPINVELTQSFTVFAEYNNKLYLNGINYILSSSDKGQTWVNLDTNSFFIGHGNYVYNMAHIDSTIIAGFSDETWFFGDGWGVAVSDDLGYNWRWSNNGLPPKVSGVYKLVKSGGDIFVSTVAAGVFKSSDKGNSWHPVNIGIKSTSSNDLSFDNEGHMFASSWANFLQKSTDNGHTWQYLKNGFDNSYFYTVISDDNNNLIAGTDKGVYKSLDRGLSWTRTASVGNNFSFKLYKDKLNRIYSVNYNSGIYRTTNVGSSWTRIDNGFLGGTHSMLIDTSGVLYAGGRPGTIYKSTNDGLSWIKLYQSNVSNSTVTGITIAPNGFIYAANEREGILKSTDNGVTWIKVITDTQVWGSIPVAATSKGEIYAGGSNYKLYRSTDTGNTWEDISLNFVHVKKIVVNPDDEVFLVTSESIWKLNPDFIPVELKNFTASVSGNSVDLKWGTATETNNKGFEIERKQVQGEWESITFIPGNGTTTEPREYTYSDNNLSPGSYKYKLIQIDYDGTRNEENEIEVEINSLPFEYALYQNYPNPFNPTTTIKYSVKEAGVVSLKVYDILGKEIATLVNEIKTPGEYTTTFDASLLSSGIYFYTMQAGGFSATNKLLLVK
jgi:photosystem II stability/assembly factor-like uncharacterized protein